MLPGRCDRSVVDFFINKSVKGFLLTIAISHTPHAYTPMSLEVVVRNPAHPDADIVIADAEPAWTVLAVKRRIAAVHLSHPVCVAAAATLTNASRLAANNCPAHCVHGLLA